MGLTNGISSSNYKKGNTIGTPIAIGTCYTFLLIIMTKMSLKRKFVSIEYEEKMYSGNKFSLYIRFLHTKENYWVISTVCLCKICLGNLCLLHKKTYAHMSDNSDSKRKKVRKWNLTIQLTKYSKYTAITFTKINVFMLCVETMGNQKLLRGLYCSFVPTPHEYIDLSRS